MSAVLSSAPVGVHPSYQRRGVGKALIARGVEMCKQRANQMTTTSLTVEQKQQPHGDDHHATIAIDAVHASSSPSSTVSASLSSSSPSLSFLSSSHPLLPRGIFVVGDLNYYSFLGFQAEIAAPFHSAYSHSGHEMGMELWQGSLSSSLFFPTSSSSSSSSASTTAGASLSSVYTLIYGRPFKELDCYYREVDELAIGEDRVREKQKEQECKEQDERMRKLKEEKGLIQRAA